MPLTAVLLVLTAFLLGRVRNNDPFENTDLSLGEYGRSGPVETPAVGPATGPYPFDEWIQLPPGSKQLGSPGAFFTNGAWFAEFLIPGKGDSILKDLSDQFKRSGFAVRSDSGQSEGFTIEGSGLAGSVQLVANAGRDVKVWIVLLRANSIGR
jgi:hypothetical protein